MTPSQMAAVVTITTIWTLNFNDVYDQVKSLRSLLQTAAAAADASGQIDPSYLAQLAPLAEKISHQASLVGTYTLVVLAIYAGVSVAIFLVS
jgi:hypothetical protein